MLNALGSPQSVLVLGATSDIAAATLARFAGLGRLTRVYLAGRPGPRRDAAVDGVRGLVGEDAEVRALDFEAANVAAHEAMVATAFGEGDLDVAVVAFGVLPAESPVVDPVAAAEVVTVNLTGAVSTITAIATRMRAQGHGVIVVLSSVAGERPRKSNYLYGATKAGLDAFANGLADELHGSGVTVLVVRPGFVRTSMTAGLAEAPLAVEAGEVADAITAALTGPSRTIWVPRAMRPVMSVLRHLPRPVFRRLPI